MTTESSAHYYLNWMKERIDEMDATLASLEGKAGEMQADARAKAEQLRTDLQQRRDKFREAVKKQAETTEAELVKTKAQLEVEWNAFETDVQKYFENIGERIQQRQTTFKSQADAQIKAWREAADQFSKAADQFAADRRSEIDAAVNRMKADAAAAESKLGKLNEAGSESWSIFTNALAETRATFDRANQATRDAFKRASA